MTNSETVAFGLQKGIFDHSAFHIEPTILVIKDSKDRLSSSVTSGSSGEFGVFGGDGDIFIRPHINNGHSLKFL